MFKGGGKTVICSGLEIVWELIPFFEVLEWKSGLNKCSTSAWNLAAAARLKQTSESCSCSQLGAAQQITFTRSVQHCWLFYERVEIREDNTLIKDFQVLISLRTLTLLADLLSVQKSIIESLKNAFLPICWFAWKFLIRVSDSNFFSWNDLLCFLQFQSIALFICKRQLSVVCFWLNKW